ncbi:hypothetical protein [Thioflavicoccus mobilis]|uniref:hypothetical protein n=1 Tax=Thioflavicoccus mobilis TaxID=80679 RepID=UPI0012F76A6B|nr:hypothetical protein [Thioflavicoccus mobilis]
MVRAERNDQAVEAARLEWLAARDRAGQIARELFQPGSGYGDPFAQKQDEHKLQTAREEAEQRFREYYDLDRQHMEGEMLRLQRSQRLATWASFTVAAVVGAATVFGIVTQYLNNLAH